MEVTKQSPNIASPLTILAPPPPHRYKYKLDPPTPTCTGSCKASELCSLVTTQIGDDSHCTQFLSDTVTMADLRLERTKRRNEC